MANYVIDNNGNWSTKKKNKKGTNYTIDTQGNWTSDAPKKVETTVKQIPNYKPTKSTEPTTLPYKPSENKKTKVKTLPYKPETTTEPTTSPALALNYDKKNSNQKFDTTTKKETKKVETKKEIKKEKTEAEKKFEETQLALKNAENDLNVAKDIYNNKLVKELQNQGVSYETKFDDLSKQQLSNDKTKNFDAQKQTNQFVETNKKANEIKENNLQEEQKKIEEEYNKWKIANYENNVAKVNQEDTTFWDKTLLTPVRAVQDLLSPISIGEDITMTDEKGNKTFLPSYNELKQQKVREDTTGLGGFLQDVVYNSSKIAAAGALDSVTGGIGGKALYWTDMAADNYKNIKNQGYDNKQAIINTIISTGSEYLTEKFLGGFAKQLTGGNVSDVQKGIAEAMYKLIKNPKIANIVGSMGSEGLEEFVQEWIEAINNKLTLGQDIDYLETLKNAFYSFAVGAGSGGLITGMNNNYDQVIDTRTENLKNQLKEQAKVEVPQTKGDVVSNLTGKMDEARVLNKQTNVINDAIKKGYESFNLKPTQEVKQTVNTTEYNNQNTNNYNTWYKENFKQLQNKFLQEYNQKITKQTAPNNSVFEAFAKNEFSNQNTQEVDVNKRINEFRKSLQKENIQDKDGFYNAVEKIIKDKNYNVIMDSSITNQNGQSVDAQISNEDGITIKINPKSPRAGEILLMHEVTHAIQNDTINKMIMDYASTNPKFNEALESLKRAYGTNEITPEVAADISGQLFGNQEFINKLATQKPSLFKQIYNEIKYLWHQLRGYKNQNEFIEDLYNKWENAYRKSNIESSQENLKDEVKYSQDNESGNKKYVTLDVGDKEYHILDGKKKSQNQKTILKDNNGRNLSVDQQKFYKNISPEMIDKEGNLITIYHTTTDPITQFNVFNPIGTPGYHFDDQVVIYGTNSKEMSGSYAHYKYKTAFTKKIESIADFKNAVENNIMAEYDTNIPNHFEGDVQYDVEKLPNGKIKLAAWDDINNKFLEKTYTEQSFYRNAYTDMAKKFGEKDKIQYETYFNLENPLVIDVDGSYWDDVGIQVTKETQKSIEELKKHKKELNKLLDESKKVNEEYSSKYAVKHNLFNVVYNNVIPYEFEASNLSLYDDYTKAYEANEKFKELTKNMSEREYEKFYDENVVDTAYEYGFDLPNPNDKVIDVINKTAEENNTLDDLGILNKVRLERIKQNYRPSFGELENLTVAEYYKIQRDLDEKHKNGSLEASWFWQNIDNIVDKDVTKSMGFYALPKMVENDFSKESIYEFGGRGISTNDIVKYIIAENKTNLQKQNYDGIIFRNVIDYGFSSENYEPEDVFVAFDSSKVKSVDNKHPTSDPDIRYSQKANKWRKFVEENFSTEGTRTYFSEKAEKNAMKKTTPKEIVAKNKSGKEIKLKQDSKNSSIYNEEVIKKDLKDITNTYKDRTVTKGDLAVSNFYSNITEKTKFLDTSIREFFKTEEDLKFYNKVTNEESLIEANKRLGKTVQKQQKAFDDFISKTDQFDSVDMAEGWMLLQRFNDAADYDRSYLVAKKMKEMGTKSGQAIQMLGLESRLTPEGMYKWAVGELMDAEKAYNSQKGRKKSDIVKYQDSFKLTTQETEFIKTQMEKVEKLKEMNPNDTTTVEGNNGKQYKVSVERAIDIELAKINSMLQDKLPHQKGRSLKSWMRMSMLFNPKTQVRNVVGNSMIVPTNMIADVFGSAADKVVSKYTGVRTLGAPSLGGAAAYVKGFKSGLVEATQDWRMGIDTKDVNQNRFEIGQGKQFNENHTGPFKNARNKVAKGLNAMNDFLGYIMDAGDRGFYRGSMEQSLYNQMKLNGVNEVTNEMAEIATNEGLQRTWNDTNEYTQAVLNLRRSINQIGNQMHVRVGEYGLGDLMIPFAKTPANLTKAIVDYSPAGFLNVISEGKNLKRAIETGNFTPQMQHDFAQNLGKATAGTLLYAIGVGLAKAGWTTGNSDDDKDLKNFMKDTLGIQPYSAKIKINGKQYSFTYDWAQPVAAPIAITADIEKGMQENMNIGQAIQHFLTTGFNILTQQSFLTGINDVLNNNDGILEGIEQQVVNIPATAMPTFLKQITDMFDTTKRITYTKEGQIENMKKTAMSKDPRGSKKLAKQYDVLGNEVEKYGGSGIFYPFKVFISPSNITSEKTDEVAKEIYSLYEATGDKTIIPRKVDYSTKINGETKTLNDKEISAWQKASGELVTKEVKSAMNNSTYKNMNKEQKAQVINKIVNYSYQKAKSETFDTPMSSYYNSVEKAQNKGMGIAEYYISVVNKNSK